MQICAPAPCPALELHVAVPHAGHLDASSRDDLPALPIKSQALKVLKARA